MTSLPPSDSAVQQEGLALCSAKDGVEHPIIGVFDDVLADIFLQYAESIRQTYYTHWREERRGDIPPHPFTWLSTAHVCHRWRDIALASPRLWSHVDARYKERTATFLSRSGMVPLTIRHYHSQFSVEAIHLIFANISRVRMLSFPVTDPTPSNNYDFKLNAQPVGTPVAATEVEVPNTDAAFIKSLAGPQLTRLSIGDHSRITVAEWVDVLSGLPGLLELEAVFSTYPTDDEMAETKHAPASPKRLVSLLHLQYLHLSSHYGG